MFFKIFITFSVRAFGALSAFILSFLIAQKLSIEEAGYFFLTIAVLGFFNVFNLCGMHVSSLRFMSIAHHKDESKEITSIALLSFFIVLAVSLTNLAVFYFCSDMIATYIWDDKNLAYIFLCATYISVPVSLNMLVAYWLQALSKPVATVLFLSVNIPFSVSVGLLLMYPGSAIEVLELYFYMALISLFLCLFVFVLSIGLVKPKKHDYVKVLKASLPLWVTSIVYVLINWSGQFMASFWVESDQLALLAIANRSAMLISLILVVCNMVVAPKYASLYSENKIDEMALLAKTITKLLSLITIPLVLLMILYADVLLSFFGKDYMAASILLIVLLIGQLINVVSGSVSYLLNMSGNEIDMNNIAITTGVLIVALNFLLIPTMGVLGAAIGTAIAVSFQNIVSAFFVQKRLGFNVYKFFKKV